jgi:hypothetical protein
MAPVTSGSDPRNTRNADSDGHPKRSRTSKGFTKEKVEKRRGSISKLINTLGGLEGLPSLLIYK